MVLSEHWGDSAQLENPKTLDFMKGGRCRAALQPVQLSKEIFRSKNICNTDTQRLNLADLVIEIFGGFCFLCQVAPQLQLQQQLDFSHGGGPINNLISFSW